MGRFQTNLLELWAQNCPWSSPNPEFRLLVFQNDCRKQPLGFLDDELKLSTNQKKIITKVLSNLSYIKIISKKTYVWVNQLESCAAYNNHAEVNYWHFRMTLHFVFWMSLRKQETRIQNWFIFLKIANFENRLVPDNFHKQLVNERWLGWTLTWDERSLSDVTSVQTWIKYKNVGETSNDNPFIGESIRCFRLFLGSFLRVGWAKKAELLTIIAGNNHQ